MEKIRQILNWIRLYKKRLFPISLGAAVILIPITYLAIRHAKPAEAAKLSLSTGSGSITIDVDDRYRAVMETGATEDYITFYDREEDNGNPDATHEIIGPRFKDGSGSGDPFVKSVEYVEISLTGTSASANLTKGQTIGDCVPFASMSSSGTDDVWEATLVDIYFESGPKVTAARSSSTGTVTVGVFVVEFDTTKVDVQQGTITSFGGTSTTESITTVTSSKAAMVFYYENQSPGADDWDHSSVAGWFSDTSTLSFQRDVSDGTINGHYYVFEAQNTEFSVQSGNFSVTGTSNTDTITSVDTSKSFVIGSYRTSVSDDNSDDGAATIALDSATAVAAARYATTGALSDVRYFVVEFSGSGNENVYRGSFNYTGAGNQDTDTITQVNTAETIAWNVNNKPGGMRNDDTGSADVDEGWQRVTLADSTTVQGDRDSTGSTAQGAWEVIEFDLADGINELRSDPNRTTTILEATDTRVKIRVEGCLYDAGSCLDDGTNDITVTEEYVFTPEGMFVNQESDWQTSGKALPSTETDDGYTFAYVEVDGTDAAYDDTQNIYYGDGGTESSTSIDGSFEDSNLYVTLLGHGTGSYQSAIVGISQNGWFDQTGGTDDWYWDEDVSGETDRLFTREQGTTPTGEHNAQWYIQFHQKADLDSESERESFYNDYANPDTLSFTTGGSWQEVGSDEWNENEGAYTIDMSTFHTEFDLDGGTYTRHSPIFKIRDYRNINPPSNITLEGESLKNDIGFNAEIKPFSDADFYDSSATSYTQLAVGGNTGSSDEYLSTADNNYTITFDTSDYLYLGSDSKFTAVNIGLATNGSGSSPDVAWQYCSANSDEDTACDTWSSLSVTDQDPGVSDLTASGTFYFSEPGTWPGATVNSGTSLYYIRGYLNAGSFSTNPVENTITTDIVTLQYTSDISSNSQTFIIPDWASGDPPIASWGFDEGYGSTAYDSTENSNDLSVTNATWEEESVCLEGKCLHYDGTGDYATRADDPELDFAASRSFTITGWIRHPPTSSLDTIVAKYETTGADGGYKIYMESDGDLVFGIDDDNTWGPDDTAGSNGSSYDDNKWHHFAAVKNGTTSISMYIDGSLIQTNSTTGADSTLENNDTFYIGMDGDGSSNGWDGFIDEVRVYRYARSSDEVKADYTKGAGVRGASAVFGREGKDYLSEGLAGYWKLDETSSPATDFSGNGNNGTWTNNATNGNGKFGNGIVLDGTGDDVTTNLSLSSNSTNPVTISAWVNTTDTTGTDPIIGHNSGGRIDMWRSANDLRCRGYDSTEYTADGTTNITDGDWHHVVCIFDSNGIKAYVDGNLEGSTTNVTNASSSTMVIGDTGSTSPDAEFDGTIDEVRIYTRTLSPREVKTLYNQAPEAIGHWKMDENTGTTIYDSSTNENNLTLETGTTTTVAHEQTETGTSASSTSVATTSANLTAVDNHLYLAAVASKSHKTVDSVTGLGLTWTEIKAQCASDSQTGISVWYALGSPTGDGAVTANVSASANNAIAVSRYSGVNPNNPYGDNHTANINGTDTVDCTDLDDDSPTVDITTTIANAWAYGAISRRHHPVTPGTGFTERADFDSGLGGGSDAGIQIEDKLIASASTVTVDGTMDGASDWAIFAAELRPSVANEPGWSAGKYGGSMQFDGEDDYVSVSDPSGGELDFGTGSFTIEAWIKHDTATAAEGIISKYETTGADGGYVLRMESDGDLTFGVDDDNVSFPGDTATSTAATYDDNEWHHIVGVKNGTSDIKLYIDGILITTNSSTAEDISISNDDAFYVGAEVDGSTNNWTGRIDDVRVYNYARTQQQIIQDMNAGHPAPGSPIGSPVGQWNFDTGYGDTAYDTSPQGNNGTLGVGSSEPSWSNTGMFGKTLDFDGSEDYIEVSDADVLDITDEMTISAWFNNDTLGGTDPILSKSNPTGDQRSYILYTNGSSSIYFRRYGDGQAGTGSSEIFTPSSSLSTDTWYHLAVAIDEVDLTITWYLNGVQEHSEALNAAIYNSTAPLHIGKTDNDDGITTSFFDGEIDDIRLYNSELTSDQIKILYNQGAAQALGSTSTDSSGNPSYESDRSYCPPGDTTSPCEPVVHLKMDENTGTTAYDISTNENNGNMGVGSSAPSWSVGKVGSGLLFDGSDDYLDLGTGSSLQITGAITTEAWVKFNSNQNTYIVLKSTTGSSKGWDMSTNTGTSNTVVEFRIGNPADCSGSVTSGNSSEELANDVWHHLVGVFKPSTYIRLYVNGIVKAENTTSIPATQCNDSGDAARVGRSISWGGTVDGTIDEVLVYDYARTPEQVAWSYNRGAPLGYWTLDECSGTTVYDSSGKDNNGTITIGGTGTNDEAGTCSSGDTSQAWNNGTNGKVNASLDFDGTDDYVNVGTTSDYDLTESMTLAAWVKPGSGALSGTPRIITRRSGSSGYILSPNDGVPRFLIGNGSSYDTATSSITMSAGNWYHIVGAWDGSGSSKIYVNGKETGSASPSTLSSPGSQNFAIGVDSDLISNEFDGQIDEVKIFNFELSEQQVKNLFNEGAVKFE